MDANQLARMTEDDLYKLVFANIERNYQQENGRRFNANDLKPNSMLMRISRMIADSGLDAMNRSYVDNMIGEQLSRETSMDQDSIKATVAAEGDQIFELATEILAACAKLRAPETAPSQQVPVMYMAVHEHAPGMTAYGFGNTAQEAAEVLIEATPFLAGEVLDVLPVTPGCAMREIDKSDPLLQHIVIPKTELAVKKRAP